ncbi:MULTISPECIES: nuclear transport factor 2 family protein [unclassified Nocardia]|uniref:nuclear transport factor 2 family protein n=1 Tax=unclassified Nocardia TaxID=2637762 RepID=UPI0034282137
MTNNLAIRNKDLVLHGLAEFSRGNVEILRNLLHENFIEHSPGNPSGRDAFVEFIANAPVAAARLDIKRVITDDEYAVVHYHMIAPDDARGVAVVDIWRLVDGVITEHWDVVQPVPDADQLPHGMF